MFINVFVEFVVLRNITKKTTYMLQGFDLFETLAAAHCWLPHGFFCHAEISGAKIGKLEQASCFPLRRRLRPAPRSMHIEPVSAQWSAPSSHGADFDLLDPVTCGIRTRPRLYGGTSQGGKHWIEVKFTVD